jgi:hypothetical protein
MVVGYFRVAGGYSHFSGASIDGNGHQLPRWDWIAFVFIQRYSIKPCYDSDDWRFNSR